MADGGMLRRAAGNEADFPALSFPAKQDHNILEKNIWVKELTSASTELAASDFPKGGEMPLPENYFDKFLEEKLPI